jgi:hypothetical protein
MRANVPMRPELRSGSNQDQQRAQRAALGDPAQEIKRGWIGPVRTAPRHALWLTAPHDHGMSVVGFEALASGSMRLAFVKTR